MKRRILTLLLALCLLTAGCASLLERDYLLISPHEPVSAGGGNPSALRVESYQELVNAVIYLVSAGEDHGVLGLYNYTWDVEDDLARACLEVVQEDPLGAYAVDYIRYDSSLIVSYYEANIYITYRRTQEQVASIVSVTGSSAIRRELSRTLTSFAPEAVLRISYFAEDEDYILDLVRQAYYDAPEAALGMPEVEVTLYPAAGRQRIVEISLTYSENPEVLRRRSQMLKDVAQLQALQNNTAQGLYDTVAEDLTVEEGTGRSSAYDALMDKTADSEGAALAYQLLCDKAGIECTVVWGELEGAPHFWNIVAVEDGEYRHADLSAGLWDQTDEQLTEAGEYAWDRGEYPACGDPSSETNENFDEENFD